MTLDGFSAWVRPMAAKSGLEVVVSENEHGFSAQFSNGASMVYQNSDGKIRLTFKKE